MNIQCQAYKLHRDIHSRLHLGNASRGKQKLPVKDFFQGKGTGGGDSILVARPHTAFIMKWTHNIVVSADFHLRS